jgi:hypothetical protein
MLCWELIYFVVRKKKIALLPFHIFVHWLGGYQVSYQVGLRC